MSAARLSAEEYRDAWRSVFGGDAAWAAYSYQQDGVPAGVFAVVAELGQQAARRCGVPLDSVDASGLRSMMLEVAAAWCRRAPEVGPVMPDWLAVLAAAADLDAAEIVYDTWRGWVGDGRASDPEWVSWMGLPAGVGAWGWAAGLSPAEAAGMPVTELRAMAALRGYAVGAPVGGVQ